MSNKSKKASPEAIMVISDDNDAIEDIIQVFAICMPDVDVITTKKIQSIPQLIQSLQPEIIIFDLNGNHSDSFRVLSEIRQESDIPLITMSYTKDKALIIKALELQADIHITKPFHQLEFIAQVRACLRRSRVSYRHLC